MDGSALTLAYYHLANIQSFEELCQHTKWDKDVEPPPYLKSATRENIQDRIRIASKYMVEATVEQYDELKIVFTKIWNHRNYVHLDNFNIYLALEGSHSTWCNLSALPKTAILPKIEKICSHIDEYSSSCLYNSRERSLYLYKRKGFKSMELTHPDLEHTSTILCRKLELYHDQFHDERNEFLYPYTTIVASLGVGKTFAVSQLAVKHDKYVLYMNFSEEEDSYPNMSCYADQLVGGDTKIEAWTSSIKGLIHLARAARACGLSPETFFRIQTDEDYTPQQLAIGKIIAYIIESENNQDQDYWDEVNRRCYDVINEVKVALPPYLQSQPVPAGFPKLQFVVCIDGVNSILQSYKGPNCQSNFNCLQKSLLVLSESEKAFFAVLVDRSAAIMDLSPAIYQDPNQKVPNDKQLSKRFFPPFIQLFTKSLVTPYNMIEPDSTMLPGENILALGRPLLGVRLLAGGSFQDVQEIIPCYINKVSELAPDEPDIKPGLSDNRIKQIALLSYRINFAICDSVLAKELVHRWMFNLIDVSEDREHLLVAPPSEPILATISRKHGIGGINDDFLAALEVFEDFLYWRIVAIENKAEFVAGLVGLIGCDAARTKIHNGNEYSSPALVLDFLRCLTPPCVTSELTANLKQKSPLGRMISSGKMSFNRIFRRVTLPSMPDVENMYKASAACFLPGNSIGREILIPTWVPATGKKPSYVGCILMQVKDNDRDSHLEAWQRSTYDRIRDVKAQLGFDYDAPFISLVVYLEVSESEDLCETKVIEFPTGYSMCHNSIVISLSLNSLVHCILESCRNVKHYSLNDVQRFVEILQILASPCVARRDFVARYKGQSLFPRLGMVSICSDRDCGVLGM